MNEQELAQALRHALRRADPGEDFSDRVMARIYTSVSSETEARSGDTAVRTTRRVGRPVALRWGLVALVACVMVTIGVGHWRRAALERQRTLQAQTQLLQALRITSANLNAVRGAVAREEEFD